ncbi:MAG: hypothetical protein ACI9RM_002501, partial [Ulvibacter sp.]
SAKNLRRSAKGSNERSRAVQAICIPLNLLMFSVVILRTGFPT